MSQSHDEESLTHNHTDKLVSVLRGTLGGAPWLGAALSEAVSVVIPNQRIDRIADMLMKLSAQLDEQKRGLVQKRVLEPEGIDILEEALWQSARALTEERRQYIASILSNGLTADEINLIETKKVLQLLSQLNDAEIVLLHYHASVRVNDSFRNKFKEIINKVHPYIGAPQDVLDKSAVQTSLRHHLMELGLLAAPIEVSRKLNIPEVDEFTGELKRGYPRVTLLGKLLLRSIDFTPNDPHSKGEDEDVLNKL